MKLSVRPARSLVRFRFAALVAFLVGGPLAIPAVRAQSMPESLAQLTPEALRARTQLERAQQSEETVQRLRQSQAVQDAITRGTDPSRVREFDLQWRERVDQERLDAEQRLRMQSGAAGTTTSPEIELLRLQAERESLRQGDAARPAWGPVLDPPRPRAPPPGSR